MANSRRLFQSYAHDDFFPYVKGLMTELKHHFRACHTLDCTIWSDEDIGIGVDWDAAIKNALTTSNAGFLMVSPAALGSTYIRNIEIPSLLPNSKLLLVGLRPVDFRSQLPAALSRLQVYRHKTTTGEPRFYSECDTRRHKEAFAFGLYQELEKRLA